MLIFYTCKLGSQLRLMDSIWWTLIPSNLLYQNSRTAKSGRGLRLAEVGGRTHLLNSSLVPISKVSFSYG